MMMNERVNDEIGAYSTGSIVWMLRWELAVCLKEE